MEIKAQLTKPYTDKQRTDFIVSENHQKGYQIKETETTLEAWGYTDEEKAAQQKQAHKKELIAQLDDLDLKAIRALRALSAGVGTVEDKAKLEELESQATEIRRQIKEL